MKFKIKSKKSRQKESYKIVPAKVIKIPVEQEVIIPDTKGIKNQKKISKKEMDYRVNSVRKYLSKNYGGYTSVKATGGYILEKNGKLILDSKRNLVCYHFHGIAQNGQNGTGWTVSSANLKLLSGPYQEMRLRAMAGVL
jgi:hypothetical protein